MQRWPRCGTLDTTHAPPVTSLPCVPRANQLFWLLYPQILFFAFFLIFSSQYFSLFIFVLSCFCLLILYPSVSKYLAILYGSKMPMWCFFKSIFLLKFLIFISFFPYFPVYFSKYFLNILFIYVFVEREEGRKRGGETSMCGCLSCAPLGTWLTTQACALIGNQTHDPLVHRPALNPLSHTSQGYFSKY